MELGLCLGWKGKLIFGVTRGREGRGREGRGWEGRGGEGGREGQREGREGGREGGIHVKYILIGMFTHSVHVTSNVIT